MGDGMRALGLAGAPNTRDLGGIVAVDGRSVRDGRLVRASALGRLTDSDVDALRALGLRTVVDLRDASEVALAPPDRLPEPGPRVAGLPVYDPQHPVFTYVSAVLLGNDHGDGYTALAEEGTPGAMAAIYRWFVNAEPARANFGAAVRLVAADERLPALVHCSAGKDRTGWLAAIVLTILGVDRDTIEADYLATNDASARVNEAILTAMRERRPDLDPDAVRPVFEARREYLSAAYAEAERVYGGFDGYLRHGLGLDDAVIDAVRANLLD
jgi:protein-tyrosine phosphatase